MFYLSRKSRLTCNDKRLCWNFRPWGMGDRPRELIALNLSQQTKNTKEIPTPKIIKATLLLLMDMKGTTIVLNWQPEVSFMH